MNAQENVRKIDQISRVISKYVKREQLLSSLDEKLSPGEDKVEAVGLSLYLM